jgi:hypothetical protein
MTPRKKKFGRALSDNERKGLYTKFANLELNRCFEPTQMCTAKAIKAHSIQNRGILEQLINKNGHVIMPKQLYKNGRLILSFETIGRYKATTFTGLCNFHDSEIFEPLEKHDFKSSDRLQLFLLAYRAVLRELHAVSASAYKVQLSYQERVKRGLSPSNKPDIHGMRATGFLINAYETYLYKQKFDELYLAKKITNVIHHIITFTHKYPTISVNSLLSLDNIETPHYASRIALNIFPNGNTTHIVFSFLPEDAPYARIYLKDVFCLSGKQQLNLISKIVLESCENFVISPDYFDKVPLESKETMINYFAETITQNKSFNELDKICLFSPSD